MTNLQKKWIFSKEFMGTIQSMLLQIGREGGIIHIKTTEKEIACHIDFHAEDSECPWRREKV